MNKQDSTLLQFLICLNGNEMQITKILLKDNVETFFQLHSTKD